MHSLVKQSLSLCAHIIQVNICTKSEHKLNFDSVKLLSGCRLIVFRTLFLFLSRTSGFALIRLSRTVKKLLSEAEKPLKQEEALIICLSGYIRSTMQHISISVSASVA